MTKFRMPIGKHKGRALATIAATDEGLAYLGWCAANLPCQHVREEIETFMAGRDEELCLAAKRLQEKRARQARERDLYR
jgi:hypothetical protein